MSQDPWNDDLGDAPTQPIDLTIDGMRKKYTPVKVSNAKFRNVCVTYNFEHDSECDDEDVQEAVVRFKAFAELSCRYACFQLEKADRLHIQAYFELDTQMRQSALKKALGSRAHFEPARAGRVKNKAYCAKKETSIPGTFFEHGAHKVQGRRTDLHEIKELMDQGSSSAQIAESHFPQWTQYNRSFEKYQALREKANPRTWKTKTIVLWGPTGTGKSLRAREMTSGAPTAVIHLKKGINAFFLFMPLGIIILLYFAVLGAEWWDAYNGEENVIVDDFEPDQLEAARFKNLFDRYQMQVPVKGGFRNWNPRLVVITTNVDPATWYTSLVVGGDPVPDPAVQRRLDQVTCMDQPLTAEEFQLLSISQE